METVIYYAMLLEGDTRWEPSGIARRATSPGNGLRDEVLTREGAWSPTPLLVGWQRGDSTFDFVEITAAEAARVIERLRERWGSG
jgi:hypothetical protein